MIPSMSLSENLVCTGTSTQYNRESEQRNKIGNKSMSINKNK